MVVPVLVSLPHLITLQDSNPNLIMNATAILNAKAPESIFPNDLDQSQDLYRSLMKEWHPDLNKDPDATKVTKKLQEFYEIVKVKIENKTWSLPNVLVLHGKDKKERTIRYMKHRSFELGEMYYGDSVVCYVIKKENTDLYLNALATFKKFTFATDDMKQKFENILPKVLDSFTTTDDSCVLVLSKTKDMFCLQDVLDASGGKLDPKHVAWIGSRLHNLASYFRYIGITHNGITPVTCFVSPEHHSVVILGGWWYSKPVDATMVALSQEAIKVAPTETIKCKRATHKIDLNLVRKVCLICLGDYSGTSLLHDGTTPKPLVEYLRSSTAGDAFEDYNFWQNTTLIKSFGKPKFTEMKLSRSDIYKD